MTRTVLTSIMIWWSMLIVALISYKLILLLSMSWWSVVVLSPRILWSSQIRSPTWNMDWLFSIAGSWPWTEIIVMILCPSWVVLAMICKVICSFFDLLIHLWDFWTVHWRLSLDLLLFINIFFIINRAFLIL